MVYPSNELALGPVTLRIVEGDPRRISFAGTEVLRRLSYPVRDENWGTIPVETIAEGVDRGPHHLDMFREFGDAGGLFTGTFRLHIEMVGPDARLDAQLDLRPVRAFRTNRAGFTILHPIRGVAARPMRVVHPDGSVDALVFPDLISPGQPAKGIVGLTHRVDGVEVELRMEGDVFEMEDQRNWSDASYKTYCRPLEEPWPYDMLPDAPVSQKVTMFLRRASGAAAAVPELPGAIMPELALAVEPGVSRQTALPGLKLATRLRIRADASADILGAAAELDGVTLELVIPESAVADRAIETIAARVRAAGLRVDRVIGLPEPYLKSHQPGGPWPQGATPADLVAPLRAAFPQAAIGGGSLTHFTEFNRCPPPPAADFVTFGNSAIVHAADDLSVLETLEAFPAMIRSARALAPGKPLHLGLLSIAMRSNPYGSGVVPNPQGLVLPMAMNDPRQMTRFAAAYGAGLLAVAAEGRVESLALAMPDGPLGLVTDAAVSPLYHVIRAAADWAGRTARITRRPDGVLAIETDRGGIIAHLGQRAADVVPAAPYRTLSQEAEAAARDPSWRNFADVRTGPARLAPHDLLFLEGNPA